MNGYVYFLTNSSMPGLVKIGWTAGNVTERVKQLEGTGVPTPFQIVAQFFVRDAQAVEAQLHQMLESSRVTSQREFFSGEARELIEKCVPLLLQSIPLGTNASTEAVANNNPQSAISDTARALLLVMTERYSRDKPIHELEWVNGVRVNWLIIEKELEELRQLGFAEFRRARGNKDWDTWRITSKGVKYLFDANLLNESELHAPWSSGA